MRSLRFGSLAVLSLFAFLYAAQAAWAQTPSANSTPALSGISVDPRSNAQIYSANGVRLRGALTSTGAGAREALLPPGTYEFWGHVSTEGSRSFYKSKVDLEPGKHYVLHASVRGYEVRVQVVERGAPRPGFGPTATESGCGEGTPGCAEGALAGVPESPPSATLESQQPMLKLVSYDSLFVTAIDGKSPVKRGLWKSENPREFKLAPGKHRIDFELRTFSGVSSMVGFSHLWLVAVPGRQYFVMCEMRGEYFSVWIEDEVGRKVGGIAGSEDEPAA